MDEQKMLEHAKNLRTDLKYSLEHDEEQTIESRDIETLNWLIQEATRSKMYKSALLYIGAQGESPLGFYATTALYEAEQRFKKDQEKKEEGGGISETGI